MKQLDGGFVQLRAVREDDLPVFYEQQREPRANAMAAFPAREREAFMAHWAKIMADESVTLRTIDYEGQVAGNMVCFQMEGKPAVGYWLGIDYWGKGIATQALKELLELVRVRPLYANVAEHNLGSIRVLEKCGFDLIGEAAGFGEAGGEQMVELVMKLR